MTAAAAGPRVVQLYDVARSAHLERAVATEPRPVLLYRRTRYDFDQELLSAVDARHLGAWASVAYALTKDLDVIEVNEPLSGDSSLPSVAFTAAARLRAAVQRRPRPLLVSYAIENLAPATLVRNLPFKARWRHRLRHLTTPLLWRWLDRIVYGTAQAQAVYARAFSRSPRGPHGVLIEALPAPEPAAEASRDQVILFLGDLSERKGFTDVMDAWPAVRSAVPGARLLMIGHGAGADAVNALAATDERVTAIIDPPRGEIARRLRAAKVLVLPSRRRPLWREQVGLPLVEGLANGCLIVTTTETGIADWLSRHDHWVLPEADLPERLAEALVRAVTSTRTPADVQADLPRVDGRRAAQDWLYRAAMP